MTHQLVAGSRVLCAAQSAFGQSAVQIGQVLLLDAAIGQGLHIRAIVCARSGLSCTGLLREPAPQEP
jgi:hypothetical protein